MAGAIIMQFCKLEIELKKCGWNNTDINGIYDFIVFRLLPLYGFDSIFRAIFNITAKDHLTIINIIVEIIIVCFFFCVIFTHILYISLFLFLKKHLK